MNCSIGNDNIQWHLHSTRTRSSSKVLLDREHLSYESRDYILRYLVLLFETPLSLQYYYLPVSNSAGGLDDP